ncbi:hypothetical protein HYY74_01550 [Candidatus Woesearchaeota archaeon]|nr:hypothetical protein [Candidatus Woesearchaeota archaeon]
MIFTHIDSGLPYILPLKSPKQPSDSSSFLDRDTDMVTGLVVMAHTPQGAMRKAYQLLGSCPGQSASIVEAHSAMLGIDHVVQYRIAAWELQPAIPLGAYKPRADQQGEKSIERMLFLDGSAAVLQLEELAGLA